MYGEFEWCLNPKVSALKSQKAYTCSSMKLFNHVMAVADLK